MSSYALSFPASATPSQTRPIEIGSEAHKVLFCRTLLDTFNPYRPAVLDWPKLDEAARERLTRLPVWDIAVKTEGRAGLRVKTYGDQVSDPLLAKAVALNAFEESRHKHVLTNLVQAYGIALAPEPQYAKPRDAEWAFMVTGYSESIDSFFAFGLFELTRRSGFFPPELVETFEPVMQEEARHILFFVNWAAPAQSFVVASAVVCAKNAWRLGVSDLGAPLPRTRCKWQYAGQQFHRHRRESCRRRRQFAEPA